MRLRALAPVFAVLDQLLRVVPSATARRHRDGSEEAHHDHAYQKAAQSLVAPEADDQRDEDRDQRRDDHLLLRSSGDDRDTARVVWLLRSVHDPWVLAELPPDLLDDRAGGAADGLDRER